MAAAEPPGPRVEQGTAAPKESKKDPATPEGWHREGFSLKKGKSKIGLAGYIQEDFRRYDWEVKDDVTTSGQAPKHELRRLRIGVEGSLGKSSFEFTVDPRNSQKGARLKDVTAGYAFSKRFKLMAGHFKPPVGQEFLTSGSKTDFVDRSMLGSRIVPDREWGARFSGEAGRFEYVAGGFAGDGDANSQTAGASGALRLTAKVVKGFSVSGSFMQGTVTPDPRVGTSEPAPKGASGRTATGFMFWDRPHVSGARRRMGGDLTYTRGALRVQAEYLELREERKGQGSTGQDIPDVMGRGWSAQAAYVVGGERKSSTFGPRRSIFKGGFGALELAARAEGLKFDDTGDPSGFAGYGNRARNILPSGATALQVGMNYMASDFVKLQGSAIWESYNDPNIAPVPGNTGRYFSLMARIQFMIP